MNYGSRHTVDQQASGSAHPREHPNTRLPAGEKAVAGASNRARGHAVNGGAPLDPRVRADMEARFGSSFQDVRIHDRNDAHHSAAELEAKAYTAGSDIAFSKDRYAPHTTEGKRLIAHELAHVVQQRRGGFPLDSGTRPSLESDAAAAADAVASGASQVKVSGASSPGVMLDRDDARKRRSRDKRDEDEGGHEKKSRRDEAKRNTQERKQQRANAGKEDTQVSRERADERVRALEKDAKAPGAKQRSVTTKQQDLKRYGRAMGGASGTQLEKNQRTGAFDESQRTPGSDLAGDPQEKYVAGGREVPGQELRPGREHFTQPDYSVYRTNAAGKTERLHVNLKSNKIHLQTPAKARATAKYNTQQAIRNAAHLPGEESIIISYAHTPSPEVRQAILEQHFGSKNPIKEVRFGTATHTREAYEPSAASKSAGKSSSKGKKASGSGGKTKPKAKPKVKPKAKSKANSKVEGANAKAKSKSKAKAQSKSESKAKGKSPTESQAQAEAKPKAGAQPEAQKAQLKKAAPKPDSKAPAEKPASPAARPDQKSPTSHTTQTTENTASSRAAGGAKGVPDAAPIEAPKVSAPIEAGAPSTLASKVRAPLGTVVEGAGLLAAVPAVKSIAQDLKDGNYLPAAGKAALLRLSFVGELAAPLAALGVGMTYWGPLHEKIEGDSNKGGEAVEDFVKKVPLVGRVPYVPKVLGATTAAVVSVGESVAYTAKDMAYAVGEGAEDVYDWLTEPLVSEEEIQRMIENMK